MPAASGKSFLRVAQAAGQNRYHDSGQEADCGQTRPRYGRELQAPGHDRPNPAAEVALRVHTTHVGPSAVRPSEPRPHLTTKTDPCQHSQSSPPCPNSPPPTRPKNSTAATRKSVSPT